MELNTLFEWTGFITGVAGVWLTIRRHIACFPVGLINVIISLVLFYRQQLYADALQQLVYCVLLSYGWIQWRSGKKENEKISVGTLKLNESIWLLCAVLGFTWLLYFLLTNFTDASFPLADSFATALAFAAQYLVARKKIENWWLWMIVNVAYIVIYHLKGLDLYLILFSIYLALSVKGLYDWKKELRPEK